MPAVQLMYTDHSASQNHLERLQSLLPDYRVLQVATAEEAIAEAGDTVAVMGHRFLRQMLPSMRRIRWVQTSAAGFDHLPWEEVFARGAVLTTAGFAGSVIAQHATMLALAMNRRLRDCIAKQDSSRWGEDLYADLPPRLRTAMVLGLGAIGGRVAAMLAAGGIDVWGLSRSRRQVAGVSRHFTGEAWKEVVDQVDLLVVCLPRSPETRSFIDSAVVEKLKATATVVNVGRSETVDLAALVRRLRAGTLGGVAIDVTPGRLPLPVDSELWQVPGLLITPYLSARYGDRGRDLESYVESQVARWVAGQPLQGVVSLKGQ